MMAIQFEKTPNQPTRIVPAPIAQTDESDTRNICEAMAEKMRELGFSGQGASTESLLQAGFSARQIQLFAPHAIDIANARAIKRHTL